MCPGAACRSSGCGSEWHEGQRGDEGEGGGSSSLGPVCEGRACTHSNEELHSSSKCLSASLQVLGEALGPCPAFRKFSL